MVLDEYDDDMYSPYPTESNKYECQKGPLEGFFVSSVEFCKHVKFDDRKDDRDNKTGAQGPPGPQGPQGPIGPQGPPGINGTNATGFTCVTCLLDALAKLETGAVAVNVSASLPGTLFNPPVRGLVSLSLPLTIDLDTANLLQAQLGESLGVGANATIFEICAVIDAETILDINAILASLETTITPIVTAEITTQITNIAQVLNATRVTVPAPLLTAILSGINFAAVVDEISLDIRASLGIFEACLGLPPTPPCEITVDTISGVSRPFAIAYDPVNERMYVGSGSGTFPTNPLNSTVYVIDTTTNTVIDTVLVGNGVISIAYDPVNERIYVVNLQDGTVSVIDTTTNTVIATIPVGDDPRGIAYDPVNERMYVINSDAGTNTVSVINLC